MTCLDRQISATVLGMHKISAKVRRSESSDQGAVIWPLQSERHECLVDVARMHISYSLSPRTRSGHWLGREARTMACLLKCHDVPSISDETCFIHI